MFHIIYYQIHIDAFIIDEYVHYISYIARTPVPFHNFSQGATPSFHAGSHKRLPLDDTIQHFCSRHFTVHVQLFVSQLVLIFLMSS